MTDTHENSEESSDSGGQATDDDSPTARSTGSITRLSRRSTLVGFGGLGLLASGMGLGNAHEATTSSAEGAVQSALAVSPSVNAPWSAHAFGNGAKAVHEGAFLIADSSPRTFTSKRPDEVRSQMPIYAPAFNTTSARAAKTDLAPVDPQTVLEGVEELSIHTWRFTDEFDHGDGTRHLGPMAEDFHDAFELDGPDDAIATVDADGVALAAIQGVAGALETRNRRLRAELKTLDDRIDELESRLEGVASDLDER